MEDKKAKTNQIIIPELIIGLGNPEQKYDQTRHNIGFEGIDALAKAWDFSLQNHSRFHGIYGEGISPNGQKIRLLKPLTYMNRSGQSVRAVADWYKIDPAKILVIYDDMDLPVGRLRIRLSGSAGGHNGMKSIIAHVNSQKFPRLRIGIGKSHPTKETISHVLGKFAPDEIKVIDEVLYLTTKAVELSLKEGIEKAMSIYNAKTVEL
jgi:peptidyl-tRNA hydrolase, PTH1 family